MTTTQTLTLTAFLLACIDEDEARVNSIPEWMCTNSARGTGWGNRGSDCDLCGHYMFDGTESVTADAWRAHMETAHNRARVLADCDAKRQIVEECLRLDALDLTGEPSFMGARSALDSVVALLAATYADHSDYREEWRPVSDHD